MSWRQKELSPPLVNTDYDYIFGMYYFIKKKSGCKQTNNIPKVSLNNGGLK